MRLIALVFICLVSTAHAEDRTLLGGGVNVTEVFATDASYQQLLTDLPTIAGLGFRHIRFFVPPEIVARWSTADISRDHVDRVVDLAMSHNLGVILAMAAKGKNEWKDGQNLADVEARWTAAWRVLAKRYAKSADKVYFELANEPEISDAAKWSTIQDRLRQHVREVAPRNTILLSPTPDSIPWGLDALLPSRDPHVAYSIHLYQPALFTLQGADWFNSAYGTVHGLEFPPDRDNIAMVQRRIAPSLMQELMNYAKSGQEAMEREVGVARGWAQRTGAQVVVTEFGVYRPAPSASRVIWLAESRKAIEAAGFGWTIWEWNSGFGIKPDLIGDCSRTRQALGFCR